MIRRRTVPRYHVDALDRSALARDLFLILNPPWVAIAILCEPAAALDLTYSAVA